MCVHVVGNKIILINIQGLPPAGSGARALELASGGDLNAHIGLDCMHRKRILHRDVKTENVFLTGGDDGVCLGDLGQSKMLSTTQSGMAPAKGPWA